MFMVKLHKPYRGAIDEVLIRGDLILEVSTRRHRKKDDDYVPFPDDPPRQAGDVIGCWVLLDRLGWTPCVESPDEVAEAMAAAEAAWRARLDAAKAARDTPALPGREHEGPAP